MSKDIKVLGIDLAKNIPRQLLLPVDDNYFCRSPINFFRPSPPQFAYF
jgi:hypothetical protein